MKDVDFLVLPESVNAAASTFQKVGYLESSQPWTFQNTKLAMHQFMRMEGEEFLIVGILVGTEAEHRKVIAEAVQDKSDAGAVRLAAREDLIWLKRARNSDQDQVDIQRLRRDEDRKGDAGAE